MATAMILKRMCAPTTRRASTFAPALAASAITIPIVAALLWITAVKAIPSSSRMIGASAIEVMNSWNRSLSAHEAEPATSNPIPWNTSPNPKIDRPTCLTEPDRTDRINATPIAIINGAQSTMWN